MDRHATCKIGYGLLLDSDFSNTIREYELAIYAAIGEHQGLNQPPHITVKRPFTIRVSDLKTHLDILERIASGTDSFSIEYGPIDWFADETAYISVSSDKTAAIHHSLLHELKDTGVSPDQFEAAAYIPHASIALEMNASDIDTVRSILRDKPLTGSTSAIKSIGLFLNVDDNHWVVIATKQLAS